MKILIQIKKHLTGNNYNYENFTNALLCYKNDLHITSTE